MIDSLDILLIIFAFGAVSIFCGLSYLIYLPFKNRLKKSGKLTDRLSSKINWAFVLLPFVAVIILYLLKDVRTSSKDRLEKISDIHLPPDFKVLADEYQDMMQDYCILYDIQLDKNGSTLLIKNIKKSKFYNKNSFHNGPWTENDFVTVDSVRAVWCRSSTGFDFRSEQGLTIYHIEFDTVTNVLKYNECGD